MAINQSIIHDLSNMKFGRWTVLHRSESNPIYWLCRCECGNEKFVLRNSLCRGVSRSCGCLMRETARQLREIDMTGKKFGRVTVLKLHGSIPRKGRGGGERTWLCRCECGNEFVVMGKSLRSGNTQSCGCLRLERLRDAIMLPKNQALKSLTVNAAKANAIRNGREWNIPEEIAIELMLENCFYCGGEPEGNMKGKFRYNGLDRVDNSKGYTLDNVVPCCMHCNRAKRTRSLDEFLSWVERVYQHSVLERNK